MSEQRVDRLAFARAAYNDVSLYDPKRAPVDLDLTDNTNLWGLPPAAERVMRDAPVSAITRYPSLYAGELKAALADYVGVEPEQIVTGSGSDDILDSAMRAFGEPGDLVVSPEPSFAMIPIFAQMNALRYRGVTERPGGAMPEGAMPEGAMPEGAMPEGAMPQPDLDAMLAAGAKIVYLCSPNNPTGALVARDTIERAVRETRGIVFIDEAYAEFAGVSAVDLVKTSSRVLVVRTLSKAFGLAGLRVGYAVGDARVVQEVEKSRGPYKLSALAERMALAALREDRAWVAEHVALAVDARERLRAALQQMGLSPLASAANFVCVPVANAVAVGQAMRARGVAARPFPALPHIGDALRISVGPWPLVERLLDVLQQSIADVAGGAS